MGRVGEGGTRWQQGWRKGGGEVVGGVGSAPDLQLKSWWRSEEAHCRVGGSPKPSDLVSCWTVNAFLGVAALAGVGEGGWD